MKLFDTHSHYNDEQFDEDREDIINKIYEAGVENTVVVGDNIENSKKAIEIANAHDFIYAAVGIHPSEIADTEKEIDNEILEIENLAKKAKVVAIGEIGLDYHWEKDNKDRQKELFKKQINIAKKLKLPIVIHSRDAFQDTYDILKEVNYKGVIHCFSGNIENANMYLSLGYYLGIGGVLTFKNTNLKETIKKIPLDRILLETDSPYLAPTPHRGEQNEPKYIPLVAEEISNILELELEKVAKITTKNAIEIFNLPISS